MSNAPLLADRACEPEMGGRGMRDLMASLVGVERGLWLLPLEFMFRTVGLRYGWLKALFERTPARIVAGLGQLRAERAAWRAVRNVPAYRRLLQDAGVHGRSLFPLGILGRLPETDKRVYVDRFGLLERCVGGSVPYAGTTIDESSGSTGTPYNWIRTTRQRSPRILQRAHPARDMPGFAESWWARDRRGHGCVWPGPSRRSGLPRRR